MDGDLLLRCVYEKLPEEPESCNHQVLDAAGWELLRDVGGADSPDGRREVRVAGHRLYLFTNCFRGKCVHFNGEVLIFVWIDTCKEFSELSCRL